MFAVTATRKKGGDKNINGKILVAVGSGATAARHALDVKIEVRILAPQLKKVLQMWRIFLFIIVLNISKSKD